MFLSNRIFFIIIFLTGFFSCNEPLISLHYPISRTILTARQTKAHCKHMKKLEINAVTLTRNYVEDKELAAIIRTAFSRPGLKSLNLNHHVLGPKSEKELLKGLKTHKNIERLYLGFTGLRREIFKKFINYVPFLKRLKEIDIASNRLEPQDIENFIKAVPRIISANEGRQLKKKFTLRRFFFSRRNLIHPKESFSEYYTLYLEGEKRGDVIKKKYSKNTLPRPQAMLPNPRTRVSSSIFDSEK